MLGSKNKPHKGHSTVESSFYGMANMLAFIAAFLVAPQIYALSADPVFDYLLDSYGDETLAELGIYIWTGLATGVVYFLARAIFVLALMLIAQRLLVLAF